MKWLVPASQKLAPFLGSLFDGRYSNKQLRRALEANLCRVNGKVERFGSAQLQRGDFVELSPSWKSVLTPNLQKVTVVFEDEFLKVVDKPGKWVSSDPLLVHRLDKDTTGLLMYGKTIPHRDRLMELFKNRQIQKTYLALVDGIPKNDRGRLESCFAKKGSFEGQTIWGSAAQGVKAITEWERLGTGKQATLLKVQPFTGRTHQIRVHMAEMGHPILVDRQYARTFRCKLFFERPLLHAYQLQFTHPFTGEEIDLRAPLPVDIKNGLIDVAMEMGAMRQLLEENERAIPHQGFSKADRS